MVLASSGINYLHMVDLLCFGNCRPHKPQAVYKSGAAKALMKSSLSWSRVSVVLLSRTARLGVVWHRSSGLLHKSRNRFRGAIICGFSQIAPAPLLSLKNGSSRKPFGRAPPQEPKLGRSLAKQALSLLPRDTLQLQEIYQAHFI
jgi:hypothetical protein